MVSSPRIWIKQTIKTMKIKALLLILLFITTKSISQKFPIDLPVNTESGLIEYQAIIVVENKTKEQLFDLTNEWFSYSFKSGKSVIDYSNKELNKVIGKGYLPFKFFNRGNQSIEFLIKLETKENKVRYTITQCIYHQSASPSLNNINLEKDSWQVENYPKSWGFKKSFYKEFDEKVQTLILSLNEFLKKENKNDW